MYSGERDSETEVAQFLSRAYSVSTVRRTTVGHPFKTSSKWPGQRGRNIHGIETYSVITRSAAARAATNMGAAPCLRDVHYVVATMDHKDKSTFLDGYRRVLQNVTFLRAVNGYNQTETIEAWLKSGLQFNNISRGGRYWGKLATFQTKFRLLRHQVEHKLPYMVALEDDLILHQSFFNYVGRACTRLIKEPQANIMSLSSYSEIMMLSLAGAERTIGLLRRYGMVRSDDQQLLDSQLMAGHIVLKPLWKCGDECYRAQRGKNNPKLPWLAARPVNTGDIRRTSQISWAEMAMLRLLTGARAASLPLYGVPTGADVGKDPYARDRKDKRGALRSKHADKRIEDCKRLRGENATSCTASRLRAEVAETRARVKMLIAAASKMTVGTEARDAAASTHK